MKLIEGLISRVESLPDLQNEVIKDVMQDNNDAITNQVRSQLMDGVDGDGNGLRPTYLEDPFFKTRQQAVGYMQWKQKITPSSTRNPENPNLFINGYFHSMLFLQVEEDRAYVTAKDSFGSDIVSKYGQKAFGVNNVYLQKNIIPQLQTELIKQFRNKLGI